MCLDWISCICETSVKTLLSIFLVIILFHIIRRYGVIICRYSMNVWVNSKAAITSMLNWANKLVKLEKIFLHLPSKLCLPIAPVIIKIRKNIPVSILGTWYNSPTFAFLEWCFYPIRVCKVELEDKTHHINMWEFPGTPLESGPLNLITYDYAK